MPCRVAGQPQPVNLDLYVSDAFQGKDPLEGEERRLKDAFGAEVMPETRERLVKAFAKARETNSSLRDAAQTEFGETQPTK